MVNKESVLELRFTESTAFDVAISRAEKSIFLRIDNYMKTSLLQHVFQFLSEGLMP